MDTLLGTARRGHAGLFWTAVAMAALAAAFLVLALVDQRELLGAPLWFKPLKFAISIAAYTAALAWMLGRLPAPALQRTGWAIVAGLWIEIVIIAGQAARGQLSHFNDDGGIGSLLFAIMGAAIAAVFLLNAAVAVRFLRERSDRARSRHRHAVRPAGDAGRHEHRDPDDRRRRARGRRARRRPGAAAGRLEHHRRRPADRALRRAARAAGAAAARRRCWPASAPHAWTCPARVRMLRVVGLGYLGLIVLLTWQALRGQPLLAPDGSRSALLALLIIGTGLGLRAARPRRAAPSAGAGDGPDAAVLAGRSRWPPRSGR